MLEPNHHSTCHTNLRYEDGVDFGVVLEILENLHPFSLGCRTIDIGSREEQSCIRIPQNHSIILKAHEREKELLQSSLFQEAPCHTRILRRKPYKWVAIHLTYSLPKTHTHTQSLPHWAEVQSPFSLGLPLLRFPLFLDCALSCFNVSRSKLRVNTKRIPWISCSPMGVAKEILLFANKSLNATVS